MERFTMRNSDGTVSQPLNLRWADALERLADYEDTGMEPEEIKELETQHRTEACESGYDCVELGKYRRLGDYDHLRDLVDAEKDGRLVVLPCKVGDTLYRICTEWKHGNKFIRTVDFNENNFWRIVFGGEFGKTVFLTREEAEAALEAREGGEGND